MTDGFFPKFGHFLGKGKNPSIFHSYLDQSLILINQKIEVTIQMMHQTIENPKFQSDISKIIHVLYEENSLCIYLLYIKKFNTFASSFQSIFDMSFPTNFRYDFTVYTLYTSINQHLPPKKLY